MLLHGLSAIQEEMPSRPPGTLQESNHLTGRVHVHPIQLGQRGDGVTFAMQRFVSTVIQVSPEPRKCCKYQGVHADPGCGFQKLKTLLFTTRYHPAVLGPGSPRKGVARSKEQDFIAFGCQVLASLIPRHIRTVTSGSINRVRSEQISTVPCCSLP